MLNAPVTSLPARPILRTLLLWLIFLGVGIWGCWQLLDTLRRDLVEFTVLLISVLLTIVTVDLGSGIEASKARKKWLWLLIPYALCLLAYSAVISSVSKLGSHPTSELNHQFGLRTVVLFAFLSAWTVIAPGTVSFEASTRLRKLQLAVIALALSAQILFGARFLRELWSAASIEQVRMSMRILAYNGLTLYFLLVAKMLLPKTVLDVNTERAEQP